MYFKDNVHLRVDMQKEGKKQKFLVLVYGYIVFKLKKTNYFISVF